MADQEDSQSMLDLEQVEKELADTPQGSSDSGEEEIEFVSSDQETQEPTEKPKPSVDIETLINARLEQEKSKQTTDLLASSLKELVETLKPKPEPKTAKPVSARLTPEERKKLNEELYSTNDPAELIDQILASKIESVAGFVASETAKRLVEQEKEILKASSEEFREFEQDVHKIVSELPEAQRYTPGIYKWALEQAKVRNIDKIVEKKLQEKMASLEKQQETKQPTNKTVAPKQVPAQGTGTPTSQKTKVYIDKATYEREIEWAMALGIGPGSSFWEETRKQIIAKYSKPQNRKVQV